MADQPVTAPTGNVTPAAPVQPTPAPATPAPAKPAQGTPAPASQPAPAQPAQPATVPITALHEEREKRQALQAELENLRRQVTQPAPQPQYQQPAAIAQVDPKEELEKLWDSDPRKAVQVEIMYAMDWRDRVDASLNQQADQLANKYPDFNNYRSSTLGYIRSLPAHQRGAPGILEAAYYMVRGQNVDTLLQQREQDLLEKYRRGEISVAQLQQPPGGFSAPVNNSGSVNLTPDQIKVADMMGMTPEQYASQIKLSEAR